MRNATRVRHLGTFVLIETEDASTALLLLLLLLPRYVICGELNRKSVEKEKHFQFSPPPLASGRNILEAISRLLKMFQNLEVFFVRCAPLHH